MDKAQIMALYDQEQRRDVAYPGVRREVTPDVVRHIDLADDGEGMIVYSQLTEANADEVIRAEIRYFEGIGQAFEWKVYDYDQPPDLKDRLAAHGFEVEEAEALMVLDLDDAPERLWQPVRHTVQRLTDPEKLADVQTIEEQVWGEDAAWVFDLLGGALTDHPDQMSVYVAYVDGQPASAAWIHFPARSQFASLWGGSTISGFRKQGLYTALLSARAQEARARGVRFLTVDASPMSRPILERFGFELFAYSYPCKWALKSGA
ncbi:MAG: GNAT family N-acetyltransferase [Chloroflexi bacterium]|nr:GNAT family N-acetyltransferase [Chloroflexota bacterium]